MHVCALHRLATRQTLLSPSLLSTSTLASSLSSRKDPVASVSPRIHLFARLASSLESQTSTLENSDHDNIGNNSLPVEEGHDVGAQLKDVISEDTRPEMGRESTETNPTKSANPVMESPGTILIPLAGSL
jgi:hypothetical protein